MCLQRLSIGALVARYMAEITNRPRTVLCVSGVTAA
jgi:hypothetical protein